MRAAKVKQNCVELLIPDYVDRLRATVNYVSLAAYLGEQYQKSVTQRWVPFEDEDLALRQVGHFYHPPNPQSRFLGGKAPVVGLNALPEFL
jgi:hypothetical protein